MTARREPGPKRLPFGFASKLLLSLMGLGVIGAAVGGTMNVTRSSFTASVVNPGNTFVAGTLTMDNSGNSPCSGVLASACGTLSLSTNTNMVPGDFATGVVTIKNSGTLPSLMTLSTQPSSVGLESSLNLTITEFLDSGNTVFYCVYGQSGSSGSGACDSTTNAGTTTDVFTPSHSNLSLPGYASGSTTTRWAPGESHDFLVTVELANTALATVAGKTATIDLIWTGIQ
ncbi:MAG TPA: hypothetical protein VMV93_01015 [Chloroflexota bacterium]|nr:hypothetical protein [Chloroflexota bacterium]